MCQNVLLTERRGLRDLTSCEGVKCLRVPRRNAGILSYTLRMILSWHQAGNGVKAARVTLHEAETYGYIGWNCKSEWASSLVNRRWEKAGNPVVNDFDQIPQLEGQRTAFDRLFLS